ncbi:hypothetical protein PsorP6_006765 [Peronosclerospora sorghi]|uniref:Uncharacterized protein n=1 Tax=Peronosclerospora sorghi TaxID=230839 RepID=A0ACC0W7E9_9STRA|nr:hypothetical protein PsorP6_006765 [Peronosclerospora sorghi]
MSRYTSMSSSCVACHERFFLAIKASCRISRAECLVRLSTPVSTFGIARSSRARFSAFSGLWKKCDISKVPTRAWETEWFRGRGKDMVCGTHRYVPTQSTAVPPKLYSLGSARLGLASARSHEMWLGCQAMWLGSSQPHSHGLTSKKSGKSSPVQRHILSTCASVKTFFSCHSSKSLVTFCRSMGELHTSATASSR